MKGLKTILGIALATTALGGAVAFGVASKAEINGAEQAAAATSTTVYYAVSSTTVGSYTVKCNVNRQGDANNWETYDMTKVSGKTYKGKDIYTVSFTDVYDGLGKLQFQLYDGSTWKSQQEPISSWTGVATYNGKLYEHGVAGWHDYGWDVTKTIYVNPYDWASLYIYYWNTGVSDATWPGASVSFTDSNLRFNGENNKLQAYTISTLSCASPKFLYQSAADTNKSDDFDVTDGSYYWHNGTAWVEETGDLAAAAKFVWDLNAARLAVTASGSVKDFSICGLNYSQWNTAYNQLSSGAKTKVNEASIFTYKDASSTGADTRVTFLEIMTYIAEASSSNSRFVLFNESDKNTTALVSILVGFSSLALFVGLFFILRKKKHQ